MKQRLESLDVLRGFDMFFITGGAGLLIALGNLVYGSPDNWIAVQMEHADWRGFHFLDLIFALFLFLAGASWPFSLARRRARGLSDTRIALGILLREHRLHGVLLVLQRQRQHVAVGVNQ